MINYKDVTKEKTSKAERDLLRYLNKISNKAAKRLNTRVSSFGLFPLDHPFLKSACGACEQSSRKIFINLYDPITGDLYNIKYLIDTVLHEVVHVKYRKEAHTKRFWDTLNELQAWYWKDDRKRE